MNEALKQNSFVFFLYNAELQIIIIIIIIMAKKTDNVQNQPRQWATCNDVHFGQFGEHSASPQYEVGLTKLAL